MGMNISGKTSNLLDDLRSTDGHPALFRKNDMQACRAPNRWRYLARHGPEVSVQLRLSWVRSTVWIAGYKN
jgi:hypothetical protein